MRRIPTYDAQLVIFLGSREIPLTVVRKPVFPVMVAARNVASAILSGVQLNHRSVGEPSASHVCQWQ